MGDKLISMTAYILQKEGKYKESHKAFEFCRKVQNYARFLNQPLAIGMFFPVDSEGNVLLKRPVFSDYSSLISYNGDCKDYDEAKEKVLFKDAVTIDESQYKMTKRFIINLNHPATFRIYNRFEFHDGKIETEFIPNFSKTPTIEYLVDFNLELTESAKKQIYGNQ